jgi:hypothetical protein
MGGGGGDTIGTTRQKAWHSVYSVQYHISPMEEILVSYHDKKECSQTEIFVERKITRRYRAVFIIYLEHWIPICICGKGQIAVRLLKINFFQTIKTSLFSWSLIMRKLYCTYTACSRSHNDDYEERTYLWILMNILDILGHSIPHTVPVFIVLLREDWTINRGPSFLAVIWFGSTPAPLSCH